MLSPLPLAMVVFGLGVAHLPVAVVAGMVTVTVMSGSFQLAAVYLAVDAAPIAILARLGLAAVQAGGKPIDGEALGRTIGWLVAVAFAAVVTGLALMSAGPDGIEATLRTRLDGILPASPEVTPGAEPGLDFAAARVQALRSMAGMLPGIAAWDWCLRALLSAGLGQLILTRMNLARWPTPAYRGFETPRWFMALFGAAAIAAAALRNDPGFIAGNAAAILGLPLVLQGLAVVHCAAALVKYRLAGLAVFYALALATAGISAVLLVGLGLLDGFLQIRARYLAPRTGGE